ncbi:MAG: Rnase Y domain-containing protein, partial [Flavobacteriales bacterium]
MELDIVAIVVGVLVGVATGGAIVYLLLNSLMKKRSTGILRKAEAEGEAVKKEKILQAKEKFLQMKEEHERDAFEKDKRIQLGLEKHKQREQQLSRQQQEITHKEKALAAEKQDLDQRMQGLEVRRQEVEKAHEKQVAQLER